MKHHVKYEGHKIESLIIPQKKQVDDIATKIDEEDESDVKDDNDN